MHFSLPLITFLLSSGPVAAQSSPPSRPWSVITADEVSAKPSYDYVIVGGGTAGLMLGYRLSADPRYSVLVVEAGPVLDGAEEQELLIPGNVVRVITSIGQRYDWNITGAPNAELNSRQTPVLTRKIVGGASSSNGMFFDRGSARDYDDWAEYAAAPKWRFSNLLAYFKRAETFSPPTAEQAKDFGITWDLSAHGSNGPIKSSYPPWIWKSTKTFRAALISLGVPTPKEHGNGDAIGALWIPNSVSPKTWTRSYAKNMNDGEATRPNYHLLPKTTATKILFKGKTAVGVKLGSQKVRASKEVILSAGAIHSPRLLQLSGVGDKRLLTRLGISVVEDLPGVGQNYQDHPNLATGWNTAMYNDPTWPFGEDQASSMGNVTFSNEATKLYEEQKTGPLTAGIGNHASFITMSLLPSKENPSDCIAKYSKLHSDPIGNGLLPNGTHPTVVSGYKKQTAKTLKALRDGTSAAIEQVSTMFALERPLSRGFVEITSTDPNVLPTVNWRTNSHPFDTCVTVNGIRFIREMMSQDAMARVNPAETLPGASVVSDEGLEAYVRKTMSPTWWHHSGTCHIGSRSDGGVVDETLKVYGIKGLRVVDASVMPMVPGTHISNTVYMIAEVAADIIKEARN